MSSSTHLSCLAIVRFNSPSIVFNYSQNHSSLSLLANRHSCTCTLEAPEQGATHTYHAKHAIIFYFTLVINHPQGYGACSLLDLCFRGVWAGVNALEVAFDNVEATELLDDGHCRWHIHLERDGGVCGAGADRELFPGSPDGLPHRAVHRGCEKKRRLARRW